MQKHNNEGGEIQDIRHHQWLPSNQICNNNPCCLAHESSEDKTLLLNIKKYAKENTEAYVINDENKMNNMELAAYIVPIWEERSSIHAFLIIIYHTSMLACLWTYVMWMLAEGMKTLLKLSAKCKPNLAAADRSSFGETLEKSLNQKCNVVSPE